MPSATVSLKIDEATFAAIDRELAALSMIGTARRSALVKAMRAAGKPVATRVKETLPKPGYPGDRPHDKDGNALKPLRDTVEIRVKDYNNGIFVVVVGYGYPAGAHGHLAEAGHRIVMGGRLGRGYVDAVNPEQRKRKFKARAKRVPSSRYTGRVAGFVEGRWDVRDAAAATESEQNEAMIGAVRTAILEAQQAGNG